MKIEWHSKITRALLFLAVLLHVGMILRALLIMGSLQSLGEGFSSEYVKLTKTLALTNAVRHAEEDIRQCSLAPSAESRAGYCRGLVIADRAALDVERAGAVSAEFTAADGREALAKAKAGTYDIIFMDMLMPEMDGFEASVKLREWEASAGKPRTRLVAFTAMATREDVDKALAAGCDDYLSKPIRKAVFYAYLVKYAGGAGTAL